MLKKKIAKLTGLTESEIPGSYQIIGDILLIKMKIKSPTKKKKIAEAVIKMFAGIGYFSLPIAKLTKAKEVIAIEKNPTAYNLLTDNIHLNKINNIIAIQGDCRIAARTFGGKANRIIMGYFPGTEQFLPAAIWMAKPGCII